jgi:tungstate transport system substrate-binding protein
MRRHVFALALLAGAAVGLLPGCARTNRVELVLVTTTSVGNSGLIDALLPVYEQNAGVRFGVHLAGSGRALVMLDDGDADVAISHAPEAEAKALATHPRWWYRKIMYNDFVLVGPPDDPSKVGAASSLEDALRRIAAGAAPFFSRADASGTYEREQALWELAGIRPAAKRMIATGQGMGTTLRVASQQAGYTLTDRATFMPLAPALALRIASEGDPRLLNTYAVIVNPDRPETSAAAMSFGRWLCDGAGRDLIASYKTGGMPAYHLWPLDRPRDHPSDLPDRVAQAL